MELYKEILDINLTPDINGYVQIDDYSYQAIKELYNRPQKRIIKLDTDFFTNKELISTLIDSSSKILDYTKLLKNGVDFINNFFKFHDINYLYKGYIIKKGSPFDIEIEKDDEFGYIICQTNIYEDETEEVIFSKIILPKYETILLPIIYTHELTHSQLYSVQGSVNNINYDELLPIFMEYLYLFETNSTDLHLIHNCYRLGDLIDYSTDIINYNATGFIDDNLILSSKYYISTILAYKLFNIYLNGNTSIRKEMIHNIQNIYDGNRSIDDTLKIYSLNYKKNI